MVLSDDVTGGTVRFLMKQIDGVKTVVAAAALTAPSTVSFAPLSTDVDTAGLFRQEWEVTRADGKVVTYPSDEYNYVAVLADLG